MLDTKIRKFVQPVIKLGADFFIEIGVSANTVTLFSLFLGIFSAVFAYFEFAWTSIIILWISGFLDTVDGTIAREKGSTSFGTVMDITFDRIVEIGIILSLAFRFPSASIYLLILSVSIIISMTVFLSTGLMTKKDSDKSFYYQAGFMERTEGFIMFSIMILFPKLLIPLTIFLFLGILFTAGQRFYEASKILK
ncbi:MAG: CDP-alcohol phosphatidyltransferase family protein [Fusobacteriaceae bacterium]